MKILITIVLIYASYRMFFPPHKNLPQHKKEVTQEKDKDGFTPYEEIE